MFDITAEDIALLSDKDTRALVVLLCESEMRRRGLPVSAVTGGGDQDAADGGIDARVALPDQTEIDGFIPRSATGFQVKKPNMARTEILEEMRPDGALRPSIRELADQGGAYIIVSTGTSLTDIKYKNRINAMKEAVDDIPNKDNLTLDFIDRDRLATWVRDHAGLTLWVKRKIGQAVLGWQPYGAWSYDPNGTENEYLTDKQVRIENTKTKETGMDAISGITAIRNTLRQPKSSVRLVGLSGVGKTRLVQALFDSRAGENGDSLNPTLAYYTDINSGPNPQPESLASDLVATGTRAILVVDNCSPDLHRRLTNICRSNASFVSVITVEYDIRDDEPEGTDVYVLKPSSGELIEQLIRRRYPQISGVDIQTISEFSGGNARIAIALAETVGKNETLSGLGDTDLFLRLFHQKNTEDDSLFLIAQACALVYSFQGEDISDGEESELSRLGAMVDKSAKEVYRGVAALRTRDLVQERSIWRAILPHAIANRLAALALKNIPYAVIHDCIIKNAPPRLLKSFSRRLGYLHDSPEAQKIVQNWLGEGGLLSNMAAFTDLEKAVFKNIAPIDPEATLAALERTLGELSPDEIWGYESYIRLLRSLAYDPALFERSAALLLKFAEAKPEDTNRNEALDAFVSLFFIYLSGTHATVEQRLQVVKKLLSSQDERQRKIGAMALDALLEAWHFTSMHSFEFGARSRDYGYQPKNSGDIAHWFGTILDEIGRAFTNEEEYAPLMLEALARGFRALWTQAQVYDHLEKICHAVATKQFWREGWIAVRQTLYFDAKKRMPDEPAQRLMALAELLKPESLAEQVRAIVFAPRSTGLNLEDYEYFGDGVDDDTTEERIRRQREQWEALVKGLGQDVAENTQVFDEILPDMVSMKMQTTLFGSALAEHVENPKAAWEKILAQYKNTPDQKRDNLIFFAFLKGLHEREPDLAEEILEAAMVDPLLEKIYPWLQTAGPVNDAGVDRLLRALDMGKANIGMYNSLAYGQASDSISGEKFRQLLLTIAEKQDGFDVALQILDMRLFTDSRNGNTPNDPAILQCGRDLLDMIDKVKGNDREDRELGRIARFCLVGKEAKKIVHEICRKLKRGMEDRTLTPHNHDDLINGLLDAHPLATLDGFFTGNAEDREKGIRFFDRLGMARRHPMNKLKKETLIEWCEKDAAIRYPLVASFITFSERAGEKMPLQWTDTALTLLRKSPNPEQVLKSFTHRFAPTGWSGSRATIIEENGNLLNALGEFQNPAFIICIQKEKARLAESIAYEREWEGRRSSRENERFED